MNELIRVEDRCELGEFLFGHWEEIGTHTHNAVYEEDSGGLFWVVMGAVIVAES